MTILVRRAKEHPDRRFAPSKHRLRDVPAIPRKWWAPSPAPRASFVHPTMLATHRPRIALAPAPGIHRAEKIAERLVEQRGLLDVHGVAALWKDRETGCRDVFLQID